MTDPARSMSLLVDMMTNTLDSGYAEAAERRLQRTGTAQATPSPARGRPGRRVTAFVLLVALGAVTGTAAAQVRRRAGPLRTARAQLLSDVHRATTASDGLARQAASLRADVQHLRAAGRASGAVDPGVADRLSALEVVTGAVPVTGPGVRVTLDDAPVAVPTEGTGRGGRPGGGRVTDRDLQAVVNGLWAAGAEAVAVSGLRLTAATAIRSAGEAVLVDFRPLSPPYRVEAVGRPDRLLPTFGDSPVGRRFATFRSLYGIGYTLRPLGSLTLPAAATPDLHLAQAGPGPARPGGGAP